MRILIAAAMAACAASANAATLIHAGRLIDGVADGARERVTVVVDGSRIIAVEPGFRAAGAGDAVVDLSDATVLPGLMDMHVHLTSEHSRQSELENVKKGEAERAYDSIVYAERTLQAGFTTVRNLGDQWGVSIALRRAVEQGKVKGPRVFTSGRSIGTRGGHADASNSWGPYLYSEDPRLDTVCNGPDSCREAVRRRYQDGSDSIKITATGGVLDLGLAALLVLPALPLGGRLIGQVLGGLAGPGLNPVLKATARYHFAFGALMSIAIAIS